MVPRRNSQVMLSTKQHFWRTLFEENDLARQIPELAINGVNGSETIRLEISHYGEVVVKAKAASTLGDNFMSDTFIVEATQAQTDTKFSGFIKVLPSNAIMREAAYESHAHHREISMYRDLFEALRRIKGDLSIPLDTPELYYGAVEEKVKGGPDGTGTCILIEDLREHGYRMADKYEGADNEHVRLALTSLAHFHALTNAALRKWTDPETGELSRLPSSMEFLLEKTFYDINPADVIKEWVDMFTDFTKDVKRPDLTEWITDITNRLPDVIRVDTLKTSGPLACILHGDFWNNNMLFRYDDGCHDSLSNRTPRPVAVRMVDFQISRIGNPTSDVLYFLYSSTRAETRKEHMIEWLQLYYDVLTGDLELLDVPNQGYTFDKFMKECRERSEMWMLYGGMVMGMVLNKKVVDSLNDMDEEMQKEPKQENDEEKEKGASGLSVELEDKMKNMMKSNKLSENALVSERLVKLFDEVKAFHNVN